MSRISRYQESVSKFVKSKSAYSEIIKYNNKNEKLLNINSHEVSIILLTVFIGLKKKKNFKSHESYHMAAGIDLLLCTIMINDNIHYYNDTFDENKIKNFINQATPYIYECLSKNLETLDNIVEKDKVHKIEGKIFSYFNKKLLYILQNEEIETNQYAHKTDIIKYKFKNEKIIEQKYKNLKITDKETLIDYIDRTYGTVCQCSFVLGWMLGIGEEKTIPNLEKLGIYLGRMIKLTNDFKNLEIDIMHSKNFSYNYIVNFGIHEAFSLFDENKVKFLEGTMLINIYNTTIKEIVDNIEKTFDNCLANSELELKSRYTSFN
jgi:hypothetical protein